MTKNGIVVRISKATNFRQVDIKKVVQMTLDGIIDVLVSEGRIELRNFGVFSVKRRKARRARNPRTGEAVMVPEKSVVTFKPGRLMQEKVHEEEPGPGGEAPEASSEKASPVEGSSDDASSRDASSRDASSRGKSSGYTSRGPRPGPTIDGIALG